MARHHREARRTHVEDSRASIGLPVEARVAGAARAEDRYSPTQVGKEDSQCIVPAHDQILLIRKFRERDRHGVLLEDDKPLSFYGLTARRPRRF